MVHFHIVVCADGFEWKDPVDPKECTACEPGEYGLSGECLKCPAGYFSSDSGQQIAIPVPVARFQTRPEQAASNAQLILLKQRERKKRVHSVPATACLLKGPTNSKTVVI